MSMNYKRLMLKMHKQKMKRLKGDNLSSKCSLKAQERKRKGNLYLKGKGYLMQDVGKRGISSKVLALKITNPDKLNKPYEHLTLKRINSIIY